MTGKTDNGWSPREDVDEDEIQEKFFVIHASRFDPLKGWEHFEERRDGGAWDKYSDKWGQRFWGIAMSGSFQMVDLPHSHFYILDSRTNFCAMGHWLPDPSGSTFDLDFLPSVSADFMRWAEAPDGEQTAAAEVNSYLRKNPQADGIARSMSFFMIDAATFNEFLDAAMPEARSTDVTLFPNAMKMLNRLQEHLGSADGNAETTFSDAILLACSKYLEADGKRTRGSQDSAESG